MTTLRLECEAKLGRKLPSARFQEALRQLTYYEREVLQLRYGMEVPVEAIADILWNDQTYDFGVTANVVSSRLYRARQRLQECLK